MLINGKPRQACSALVDELEKPIRLEPLNNFRWFATLQVDRYQMFESLKSTKCWIPIDGTYVMATARAWPPKSRKRLTRSALHHLRQLPGDLPQGQRAHHFVGAAIISQVRLFNMHPTGAMHAGERLEALMGPGGIEDCDNAQNCVKVCPKGIPLTESLAA